MFEHSGIAAEQFLLHGPHVVPTDAELVSEMYKSQHVKCAAEGTIERIGQAFALCLFGCVLVHGAGLLDRHIVFSGQIFGGGPHFIRQGGIQLEGVDLQLDLIGMRKLLDGFSQAIFANVAPWAYDIRPNVNGQPGCVLRVRSDGNQILFQNTCELLSCITRASIVSLALSRVILRPYVKRSGRWLDCQGNPKWEDWDRERGPPLGIGDIPCCRVRAYGYFSQEMICIDRTFDPRRF